jgi:hypothetical protein
MSIYSEMISKAQSLGFMPLAWDFLEFDVDTSTVANLTTETGTNVFPSIATAGELATQGLTQDGGQPSSKTDIHRAQLSGIIWIGRPSQASASILFRHDYSSSFKFFELSLDQNLAPRAGNPVRGTYINGTVPLVIDELSVVIFSYNGLNGPFLLYGTLGGTLTRIDGSVYKDRNTCQTVFYNDNFVGEAGLILGMGGGYTEAEIFEILNTFNAVGRLTLPTNLPADKAKSVMAINANGTSDSSVYLAAGETEWSAYLATKTDALLTFVAFTEGPDIEILSTGSLIPLAASTLEFTSLTGGSGGTETQSSKISGIVQIDGTPAKRTVRAFGYNPTTHDLNATTVNLSKSLGHSTSDPETGDYTIELLAGYGQEIFVVAFDDYGDAFIAEQALAAGDRIHPTIPNGHVWETTGAGALPVDEPTWVVDTETSQLYGTASMIARPFYRPMVHGPIMPEVSEAAPGDEHWDSVALLLHFNGEVGATEFVDSSTAARNVTAVNAPALIQDGRFFEAIEFEGTNQYITIPGGPWTNLSQWTDYTLEFYIYNENGGVFLTTNVGTGTYRTFIFISDKVRFRIISDGNAEVVELDTGINSLPSFAWKHVAITKKGQLWRAFIAGQLLSESLEAVAHQSIEPDMNIGIRRDGLTAPYSGRVEEFRVTPGVCRYEADFVPPTAQFPGPTAAPEGPAPALPTVIGEASNGGFYAGDISYGGKSYKLIVADKAADVGGMPIMTPKGAWPGATSQDDGMANTLSMEGDARFIAAAHCLDYAGGGFSEWYLPAENEMAVIYNNLGHNSSPPVGFEPGGNNAFAAVFYWTSTQASPYPEYNRTRRMSDGFVTQHGKDTAQKTRPIRRVEFTPES